jgi:hypothetical protein
MEEGRNISEGNFCDLRTFFYVFEERQFVRCLERGEMHQ